MTEYVPALFNVITPVPASIDPPLLMLHTPPPSPVLTNGNVPSVLHTVSGLGEVIVGSNMGNIFMDTESLSLQLLPALPNAYFKL